MAKKIVVVIEDDWEIRGNGLGKVAHLQYIPSLFLMSLCERLGIRMTFMIEVMQQFVMKKHQETHCELKAETELWEENVQQMLERGFDIQLHLHPQWHNAEYRNGFFYLSRKWNLAEYDRNTRLDMLISGKEYLSKLIEKSGKSNELVGFKAGGWAMQPSRMLLEDLEETGIKIVFGVRKGLYYKSEDIKIDYRELEEDRFPYYPDYDDLRKVSKTKKELMILPLTSYNYTPAIKWQRLKEKMKHSAGIKKSYAHIEYPYHFDVPAAIKNLSPLKDNSSFKSKILSPVLAHLNFENEFDENKIAIDQIMKDAMERDEEIVPFAIETHTKGFEGKWNNIEKALTYLIEKYGAMLEFQTVAGFYQNYLKTDKVKKIQSDVVS